MTPRFMLVKTSNMAKSHYPFVVCKSCVTAFDVNLNDKKSGDVKSLFSVRIKSKPEKHIHTSFDARCVYCGKINLYSSEKDLWEVDGYTSDYKLAEMYYAEKLAWKRHAIELEKENQRLKTTKTRVRKERNKLADTIHKITTNPLQVNSEHQELPYKVSSKNPLSG